MRGDACRHTELASLAIFRMISPIEQPRSITADSANAGCMHYQAVRTEYEHFERALQQRRSMKSIIEMRNVLCQATVHEHPDIRSRRLLFRCWHRGTQESDLILGSFARGSLETFDSDQIGRFEALLDCTDPDLFDWIFGVSDPPREHDHDVMELLRSFCNERNRAPRQIGQHRI
jgi:antitoxin CptB